MLCPYCSFRITILIANAEEIPNFVPVMCSECGEISVLQDKSLRKLSARELEALKTSPAWREFLEPALKAFARAKRRRTARYN